MILQCRRSTVRLPQLNVQCWGNGSLNIQRAASLYNTIQTHRHFQSLQHVKTETLSPSRAYATTTKPVSRPKAHTGRATASAKKAPTTSKTKAAKKPIAETSAPKRIPKTKSTPKSGNKAGRKATKKTKAKTKAKPKPKSKKKVVTPDEKKAAIIKQLKVDALKPPTMLPSSTWVVFLKEFAQSHDSPGARSVGLLSTPAKEAFRNVSPERLENLNHTTNQNKAENEKAYRQWIESYPPIAIFNANLARANLRRRLVKGYYALHDHRQVKGIMPAYAVFNAERFATGDFKGLKVPEAGKLIGREWKGLSADAKKPYYEASAQDKTRYNQERKTVLNKDPRRKA